MRDIGREEGIQQGIQGAITMLKDMGCTDEEIIKKLTEIYALDIEKAKSFLNKN